MLDLNFLKSVLYYEPTTGTFTWKSRNEKDPEMLKHFSQSGIRSFNTKYAGKEAGASLPLGYRKIQFKFYGEKVVMFAHHVAWLYMTGKLPESIIDHKDRNPSNNSWSNLRQVTRSINNLNQSVRKTSTSGVKGVFLKTKTKDWTVSFYVDGRTKEVFRSKDFFEAVCFRKSLDVKHDPDYKLDDRKVIEKTKMFNIDKIKPSSVKVRKLPSKNFQAYIYLYDVNKNKKTYNGLGTYPDYFEACCAAKSAENTHWKDV